ncbi:MAG: pilus assembly protein PilM [Bacillota bacterium]
MPRRWWRKNPIVLQFSSRELLAVQARLTSTGLLLEKTVMRPLPDKWENDSAVLGDFLKILWLEEGLKSRDVLWIVPRSQVFTREVDLPFLPDQETMLAVRMAAEENFAAPLDELLVTYRRLPDQMGRVEVLAHSIQKWQRMDEACRLAKLRLVGAPLSSWVAGQAVLYNIPEERTDQDILMIQAGFPDFEVSAWRNGEYYFHRACRREEYRNKMPLILDGFAAKHEKRMDHLFLVGKFPDEQELIDLLGQIFPDGARNAHSIKVFNTISYLATADKNDAGLLAPVIGAALVWFNLCPKGADFYFPAPSRRMAALMPYLSAGMAAAGVLLWTVGLNYYSVVTRENVVRRMQNERELFADKMAGITDDRIFLNTQIDDLKEIVAEQVSILSVWSELERALPAETRITKWLIQNGEIKEITGTCKNIHELLYNLNRSKIFSDVRMLAPIIRDWDGSSKFSIRIKIRAAQKKPVQKIN